MPALGILADRTLWDQFAALLPERTVVHPLVPPPPHRGPGRVRQAARSAGAGCQLRQGQRQHLLGNTIRTGRDELIGADVFEQLEQLCLDAYDRIVGLDLSNVTVDGCIVKAPCGGEVAGKSPVDRGKLGTKRSVLTDAAGIPLGCVIAPANRHDSPLLRPTLATLARFDQGLGSTLPEQITVHLDAGYDSTKTRDLLDELGCHGVISLKGFPLQAGDRWVVERTNSWHNRGFKKLAICTERHARVIDAFIALANAVIITRRLIRIAWTTHRWDTRPNRQP